MYAQAIEGDSWQGATLDRTKIDKMSGMVTLWAYFSSLATRTESP